MRNLSYKIALFVVVGLLAVACNKNPDSDPAPQPKNLKIDFNIPNGETHASKMDSVQAFYWTKDLKEIKLQRVPYNNGVFSLELLDTIANTNLKSIVEYYSREIPEGAGDISDKTALIAPIGIKGFKDGKMVRTTFNPVFKIEGAMFSSGIYVYSTKDCMVKMDKEIEGKQVVFDVNLVKGYNFVQTVQYQSESGLKDLYTTNQMGEMIWSVWF